MKAKNLVSFLLLFAAICTILPACGPVPGQPSEAAEPSLTKQDYALDMNTDFSPCTQLSDGNGRRAKVILLLGQSNASGCSIVEYLERNTDPSEFSEYESGYDRVKINYSIDNQSFTSDGEFVPVDLTCGCGNGFFGPEVGIADVLSHEYPKEDIFIIKFTMSGYSLNYHWLYDGQRAWIYDAAIVFINHCMSALAENHYVAEIEAIMWMQGESDTTEWKARNTTIIK